MTSAIDRSAKQRVMTRGSSPPVSDCAIRAQARGRPFDARQGSTWRGGSVNVGVRRRLSCAGASATSWKDRRIQESAAGVERLLSASSRRSRVWVPLGLPGADVGCYRWRANTTRDLQRCRKNSPLIRHERNIRSGGGSSQGLSYWLRLCSASRFAELCLRRNDRGRSAGRESPRRDDTRQHALVPYSYEPRQVASQGAAPNPWRAAKSASSLKRRTLSAGHCRSHAGVICALRSC